MNADSLTNIAFRCPYCGAVISASVSPHMLAGSFKAECIQCHKSALTLSLVQNSVRLSVPCLVCPHPHPFSVDADTFFSKDILTLPCSFSGIDVCYIGTDEDKLEDAVDSTESLIMDLLADDRDDENAQKQSDMLVADTNVVREVLFALDELTARQKIICGKCASHAVKVLIDYDTVSVVCKVCGRSHSLPARTKIDASAAIDLEELTL